MGIVEKLAVNNFGWIKHVSQFNEDFIKNCNKESHEGFYHFFTWEDEDFESLKACS